MSKEKILQRIEERLGVCNIQKMLANLPPKDFQSLLLYIYEQRACKETVATILQRSAVNRFIKPSAVSQRKLVNFDQVAYGILSDDYEAIELSPVMPFGLNAVLAGTNQKNIASTVRGVEVIADPTTALSIECAKRRTELIKLGLNDIVRLATSQRVLRLQCFDDIPGFRPHFKIFALACSGTTKERWQFVIEVLHEHLVYYFSLFEALTSDGYSFHDVTVFISDIRITEALIEYFHLDRVTLGRETQSVDFCPFSERECELPAVTAAVSILNEHMLSRYKIRYFIAELKHLEVMLASLRDRFPTVHFCFDLHRIAGIGYYQDVCFKIIATNRHSDVYPLVDGGTTNWTGQLLQSKAEQFFISGIGTEITCQRFR